MSTIILDKIKFPIWGELTKDRSRFEMAYQDCNGRYTHEVFSKQPEGRYKSILKQEIENGSELYCKLINLTKC